jgi:hypothetical protein
VAIGVRRSRGVGPAGADKGKGGQLLVLPVEFKGTVPEGCYAVMSRTSLAAYFARGIVRHGDVVWLRRAWRRRPSFLADRFAYNQRRGRKNTGHHAAHL